MAKLTSGILGKVSGKVSNVVGGAWKDKNYVRAHVIPANPNTAGQQAHRGKFSLAVAFAKGLVGQIFNVYVDQFQRSMSGFNFFIKQNIKWFTTTPTYANLKITWGKLYGVQDFTPTYNPDTGVIGIDFAKTLGNNGKLTDKVVVAVYFPDTGAWHFNPIAKTRNDNSFTFTVEHDHAGEMIAFVFAAQYIGTKLDMVSDSIEYTVEI